MIRTLIIAIVMLMIAGGRPAKAGMVVSEAYSPYNEGSDGPTWIELYNDSDINQVLSGMRIISGGVSTQFPMLVVEPYSYVVVCDNMYGPGSFESRWGDSSGIWGDRSFEELFMIVEMPIAPASAIDSIVLLDAYNTTASLLRWSAEAMATRSWERSPTTGDSAIQCPLGVGGTPGEINSTYPVDNDLAIESLTVRRSAGQCEIAVQIRNAGTAPTSTTELTVTELIGPYFDTVVTVDVPSLASGGSLSITKTFPFSDTYHPAVALLNDDDRRSNNHRRFMIVGGDYPPIMLSEIMAAPSTNGGGEWIELRRRSDTAVNLQGWSIQDASHQAVISDSFLVLSDSLALIAQSLNEFIASHDNVSVPVIDPVSWASLNNSGDIVRLVDPYGILADTCRYSNPSIEGMSLAREPAAGPSDSWHNSIDPGGTPGTSNRVLEESSDQAVLTAMPQTISPDGDGIDDEVVFRVVATVSAHCTLRIFDRNGRVVRSLLSNQLLSSNEILWDGYDANGGRLPIGIYVILLEMEGGASVRRAVVIAR